MEIELILKSKMFFFNKGVDLYINIIRVRFEIHVLAIFLIAL